MLGNAAYVNGFNCYSKRTNNRWYCRALNLLNENYHTQTKSTPLPSCSYLEPANQVAKSALVLDRFSMAIVRNAREAAVNRSMAIVHRLRLILNISMTRMGP